MTSQKRFRCADAQWRYARLGPKGSRAGELRVHRASDFKRQVIEVLNIARNRETIVVFVCMCDVAWQGLGVADMSVVV